MTDPKAIWHAEHVNFSRLLDLLEEQVAAFHRGERPNYELMSTILYYMRNFADRVHHPREDIAFARIADRNPEMQLVISRLRQEHRVIATAGEALLTRLNEAEGDVMAPRTALEAAAATYLVYYRNHISTEERDVMPRAAQILTQDDWAAVNAAVPASPDPLFGNDVQEHFKALRKELAGEARLSRQGEAH